MEPATVTAVAPIPRPERSHAMETPRTPVPKATAGKQPNSGRRMSAGTELIMDTNWVYDTEPPAANILGLQCCTSRPKFEPRKPAGNRQVWQTADLTWWDFQRRRWHTLWLMKTIYYRTLQCEEESEKLPPGPEQDAIWDNINRLNAIEMREHAEEAKGLFIKAGQAMSAMVGVLPDIYIQEFMSLTDHLPVSTIDEVFRTIRRDLQRPPSEIFSSFDPEPIASASIAQVHRAKLIGSDEVVAVKVQHEGVDRIFLEDVSTLTIVAAQLAFWRPELDFRKFAEEWHDSLPHELDFHEERRALERAGSVLRKAGNHCVVPRVHKRLFGQHVFVMEFIEAAPIMSLGDDEFCAKHEIDKKVVLHELLDAFGIMAFKDGMFHADPHAGNVRLLLDRSVPGGASPVLFDWGLFREITDEERMGLAKVFHSLANFDIAGLFDCLGTLGFHLKRELMTDEFRRDLLEKARSVMKDTITKEQTRANVRRDMEEYKERLKKAEEEGTTGEAQGSVSPIYFLEDWPRCIIFFMRMLQILRGLCVGVNAEGMPILQIFAKHAREALQEGSQSHSLVTRLKMFAGREARRKRRSGSSQASTSSKSAEAARDATLEGRVRVRLQSLIARQRIVGAQVAVIEGGRLICDIAGGTLSTIDSRPTESGTHFPLVGATAGVAALALLRALRRLASKAGSPLATKGLEGALQTPVTKVWPRFGGGGSAVTLAEVLSHSAGLQDAYPLNFSPAVLDDVAGMSTHFEQVSMPASRDARYAYLLQAFVLAKLGDCMAGQDDLLHWLGEELGPLGLDVAAPAGRGGEAHICRDLPELARVSMDEVQDSQNRRKKVGTPSAAGDPSSPQGFGTDGEVDATSGGPEGSPGTDASIKGGPSVPTNTLMDAVQNDPLVFDPLQGNAGHGGLFRGGLTLGASARGLATMLSSEALQKDITDLHALELAGADPTLLGWMLTGGACQWTTGGLQALQLQATTARGLLGSRPGGYGVVCGFGPFVAHFPDLGTGGVTIAVTVNDVLRGREAVAELVKEALSGYGFSPSWPSVPMRVMLEAVKLARSEEAAPLLKSFGGIQALRKNFNEGNAAAAPTAKAVPLWRRCCCGASPPPPPATAALVDGEEADVAAIEGVEAIESPVQAPAAARGLRALGERMSKLCGGRGGRGLGAVAGERATLLGAMATGADAPTGVEWCD